MVEKTCGGVADEEMKVRGATLTLPGDYFVLRFVHCKVKGRVVGVGR